jgi:hypothetical protein
VASERLNRGKRRSKAAIAAIAVSSFASLLATGPADGAMRSEYIADNVCKTRGGGKFVRVPGADGTKIDRRLLPDVKWMMRRYDLALGDGYARTGHAPSGEHPIGLALDIFAGNGRNSGWDKVDKLAKLAEPRQNRPILPWRWVGYDGDAGHGRGHHLHLSWGHNDGTTPGEPAKWVLTRKCPDGTGGDGGEDDGGGISARSAQSSPALEGLAPAVPEPHEHHVEYSAFQ